MTEDNKLASSSAAVQSILTEDEIEDFVDFSSKIIKAVGNLNQTILEDNEKDEGEDGSISKFVSSWITEVMRKNILGGKMLRGLMVPMAYKSFQSGNMLEAVSVEDMYLAYALGWILEILQAASLVADDVMDQSETRRGKPCWYKLPNIGLTAINDSLLLEMTAFQVLQIYFEEKPYYRELYNTLHDIVFYTIQGQSLDCHTESSDEAVIDCYTMERYNSIVKYKTSYYTTYMPVICAMIMAGKSSDHQLVYQVETIMLQIGHYFQVQDDYLDCFGDNKKTGKVGTDIQDKKCSWLFVKAVELCQSEEDLEILMDNYGRHEVERVDAVKNLYVKLGVKDAYEEYEDQTYEEVTRNLDSLPDDIPVDLFHELLRRLYKRRI